MRLFARRFLIRVRALEALVAEWEITRHPVPLVADVEQLTRECLDVTEIAHQAWSQLREMLRADINGAETESAGQTIKKSTQVLEIVVEKLDTAFSLAARLGQSISVSRDVAAASPSIHALATKLNGIFPDENARAMEEAKSAFLRGECISSEELIREAQGYSPAAH